MRIKPNVGLAVGPADDSHWGQVLVTPTGYGIVEIADGLGQAQSRGAHILSHLGEKLSHELTSLSSVEEAVDEVWEEGIQSLIVLVPVGRVVYLVLKGSGNIYVKRGHELANLMHKEGGVSGEVRPHDTLLLASQGFSRVLSHETMVSVFDQTPAKDVAEKLTLLLHEKPHGEGSVALVFDVSEFEEVKAPEIIPDSPEAMEESQEENAENDLKVSDGFAVRGKRWMHNGLMSIKDLRHNPQALRKFLVILVSSLFLLSVAAGVWKQTVSKSNQEAVLVLSDARHVFEEGVALMELNPVKGRERLEEAKALLSPVLTTVSPRSKEGRDIKILYDQITDNLTQAMQISEGAATLFYDMELLKKGARATSVALAGTSLLIGDPGGSLYRLDIATKKAEVIAGGADMTGMNAVSSHGDTFFVLTPEGIIAIKLSDKKPVRIISKDPTWNLVSSLVSFGGNLYVLDTGASRIWKYTAIEKGFSEIREYLNPDTLPDLSMATNMTIDGTVWAGSKEGRIYHFVQGKEETFLPKGVEPQLGTDLQVYSTDETNNFYILDRQNNRVVVTQKDGTYLAQYRFTSEASVDSIAVSEAQKKILLLSGGKIYSIDLK
jgi:hypothetical protein